MELKNKQSLSLRDKVILITGASRGIGAATATLAAQEGAKVVANYNKNKRGAEKVVQLIKNSGSEAIAIQADVANREQSKHMVDEIIEKWGRIDVLINNAGVLAYKDFDETSP
ncbi:SDR family NAD(P)-dependent oxidoreductase [Candidatus Microgenomates bacterium]|nr:SDR family NAD(P)-dependent oxidoreductase [Candidatus Microgenomates bacterium]